MQTAAQLKGLAVVSGATGERLGRVDDVIFDLTAPAMGQITGFLVDVGGLLTKAQLLPRGRVRSLGKDALIAEGVPSDPAAQTLGESGAAPLEPVRGDPPVAGSVAVRALDGRPVLDETGKHVGNVAGALVDETTLTVPALQIALGLVDKVLHGKHDLPLGLVRAIGPDSVLVSNVYDPHAAGGVAATPADPTNP